jgi:formylglycine-generating enzyme required for sulfatase activity
MTWSEAVEFCLKLSEQEGVDYRLPTEAQWEYACRGGTTTAYSFGDDSKKLVEYAWYDDNSDDKSHKVGKKNPNAWGLYDMHGNVWEWCQDWGAFYGPVKVVIDPVGPIQGRGRVFRGGSFNGTARNARSANRDGSSPTYSNYGTNGIRVVRTYP